MSYGYSEKYFSTQRKKREKVCDMINNISNCELKDSIKDIRSMEKDSGSNADMFKARIEDYDVIIKASYPDEDPLNNSLQVETAIYENIITKLVNNSHTPGVISYLGTLKCPLPGHDRPDISTLLILEYSHGIPMYKMKWVSLSDLLSVMFIIIYTLLCFANLGLRHNDLHFGNIFIEETKEPVFLFFHLQRDLIVRVKTRYIPKIYDFDTSAILYPSVPRNLMLDAYYCVDFGNCNIANSKYDLFKFLKKLYDSIEKESILVNRFFSKILDLDWFQGKKDFLRYQEYLSEEQLPSHEKLIEVLYSESWDNSPFTILRPPASIPKGLVFSPPPKRHLKIIHETIYSLENNEACSIDFLSGLSSEYTNDDLDNFLEVWQDENDKYGIAEKVKGSTKDLSERVLLNIPISWKRYACIILMNYQYHTLDKETRQAIVGSDMMRIISNIWNSFNNSLPVKIYKIN
jgi:hypothetical protein